MKARVYKKDGRKPGLYGWEPKLRFLVTRVVKNERTEVRGDEVCGRYVVNLADVNIKGRTLTVKHHSGSKWLVD